MAWSGNGSKRNRSGGSDDELQSSMSQKSLDQLRREHFGKLTELQKSLEQSQHDHFGQITELRKSQHNDSWQINKLQKSLEQCWSEHTQLGKGLEQCWNEHSKLSEKHVKLQRAHNILCQSFNEHKLRSVEQTKSWHLFSFSSDKFEQQVKSCQALMSECREQIASSHRRLDTVEEGLPVLRTEKEELKEEFHKFRHNVHLAIAFLGGLVVVLLGLMVLLHMSMNSGAVLPRSTDHHNPVHVYVQRDRQSDGVITYMTPQGESPESLLSFIDGVAKLKYKAGAEGTSQTVYVSMASSSRLDEVVFDWSQVDALSHRIAAFLFIWVAPKELCMESKVPQQHRLYVQKHFGADRPVAFVCWMDGFLKTSFTMQSLHDLDDMLQQHV